MTGARVLLSIDGAVATVSLNRPEARNGLVRGMGGEVCRILRNLQTNDQVRVVVLRGVGVDFCPGADLNYRSPPESTPPPPDFDAYQVTVLLHEMPKVTIAAIRGACAGAGLGWALACDLRLADDTARINTAFLDVGVAGDMGVPWTLPRIVGSARARDLMFFPRKLDGDMAKSSGVVDYLYPATTFEADLDVFTRRLAAAAPLALVAMKQHFVEAESTSLRSFIAIEAKRHIELLQTNDHDEAKRAWLEKRAPRFEGR